MRGDEEVAGDSDGNADDSVEVEDPDPGRELSEQGANDQTTDNTESERTTKGSDGAFLSLGFSVEMHDEMQSGGDGKGGTDTHESSEDDEGDLVPQKPSYKGGNAKTTEANVEDVFRVVHIRNASRQQQKARKGELVGRQHPYRIRVTQVELRSDINDGREEGAEVYSFDELRDAEEDEQDKFLEGACFRELIVAWDTACLLFLRLKSRPLSCGTRGDRARSRVGSVWCV